MKRKIAIFLYALILIGIIIMILFALFFSHIDAHSYGHGIEDIETSIESVVAAIGEGNDEGT